MDVGPTDDMSRFGIPLTDNWINFEDLMVLAMNYGRVSPTGRTAVPALAGGTEGGALGLALAHASGTFEVGQEIQVELVLNGNSGDVKGMSAAVSYDPEALALVGVTPAVGLTELGDDAFFMWRSEDSGVARVDLALLGTGTAMAGSGAVATLTFSVLRAEPTTVEFTDTTVRDTDNRELAAPSEPLELGGGVPLALRLLQNAPNPFNPMTTVAFEVPERCEVRVSVYSPAGRFVCDIANGTFDAGRHSERWNGRDANGAPVASGVYFCVLEAAGERLESKMVLIR
jgi:hypothetical protein